MCLLAIGPAYAKMNWTILGAIELEKAVSKAIEAVEGTKLYPARINETPLGSSMELCAVVPKDRESLKADLQTLGFELVDTCLPDGTSVLYFAKKTTSPMPFRVLFFENEADATNHLEPKNQAEVTPVV